MIRCAALLAIQPRYRGTALVPRAKDVQCVSRVVAFGVAECCHVVLSLTMVSNWHHMLASLTFLLACPGLGITSPHLMCDAVASCTYRGPGVRSLLSFS